MQLIHNPLEEIKAKISTQHENDKKQLEVIFSDNPRLMVEAPAGYGKTTTMISRIAYLFASGNIPNPKRVLGLTFSINAALKIKREVAEKLPLLMSGNNNIVSINNKITITNYHGFCKGVLKKYGYLVSNGLRKDINTFKAIGDHDIKKEPYLKNKLTWKELDQINNVTGSITKCSFPNQNQIHAYNNSVITKLLPLGFITHTSVILFVLQIFQQYKLIKEFYQSFYPLIVVDEFQDTNCIAWFLLKEIVSRRTKLVFLGDPLQRIYSFIGAIPDIIEAATKRYAMTKIALSTNYRFRNNEEMLKLDKNIRENATSFFSPVIRDMDSADLPILWGNNQQEEAVQIVDKVKSLIVNPEVRIAILFKNRGVNADIIESEFANRKVSYFYGMFTDEDTYYVDFHKKCQELFIKAFDKSRSISKKALIAFSVEVRKMHSLEKDKTVLSLLQLLDALIEKVTIYYIDLPSDDKYNLFLGIFENRQLKQAMEYVNSQVILSTIHGAKGLEWDYVIIPDVEQRVFTFNCTNCSSEHKNILNERYCRLSKEILVDNKKALLDDLCVFYVGLTRARKQAYISASREGYGAKRKLLTGGKICCLALIDGIKLVNGNSFLTEFALPPC